MTWLWAALLANAGGGLSDGLTFYLPLDGQATPVYAEGRRAAETVATEWPDGKAGRAMRLGGGMAAVTFPAAGNVPRDTGSVAFWVRPEWAPADRGDAAPPGRMLFTVPRFNVMWQKRPDVLFFMTGDVVTAQAGYQWDYGVAVRIRWPRGEWRHVAVTWDKPSGTKRIYIDGAMVAEGSTDRITGGFWDGDDEARFGSPEAPGDYDELAVWSRVLSPGEVQRLFADPAGAATELAGKAPRPEPEPWPLKVGLAVLAEAETIVAPGTPKTLQIPIENPGQEPVDAQLRLVLKDVFLNELAVQDQELHLAAGAQQTLPVTFATDQLGVFKVALTLNGTWHRDVGGFAVWPDPPPPAPDGSFFGSHIEQTGGYVAQAARLGQNWARGHNMLQSTWWSRVQPEPGPFDWGPETTLRRYQAAGIHVLGQFFATPYWAATAPAPRPTDRWSYPAGLVPRLDALAAYVTAVVGRYRDWIHHWEIWNEPEVSIFYQGTPEQFAEICRVCYTAAKAADPECVVLAAGFTSSDYDFHEAAAKAGALRYCDGISFHGYASVDAPPERVLATVDHFRDLARRYGRQPDLPLWSTEAGVDDTTFYEGLDFAELPPEHLRAPLDFQRGAARAVQGAVVLLSARVARHFYYLQKPPGPATAYRGTQNLEITRVPRPKLMARRALAREVDDAVYARLLEGPHGLQAHVFAKGAGSLAVLWCADGDNVTIPAPPGTVVVDLMGNPRTAAEQLEVTDLPVYLRAPKTPPATLLATLGGR